VNSNEPQSSHEGGNRIPIAWARATSLTGAEAVITELGCGLPVLPERAFLLS